MTTTKLEGRCVNDVEEMPVKGGTRVIFGFRDRATNEFTPSRFAREPRVYKCDRRKNAAIAAWRAQ